MVEPAGTFQASDLDPKAVEAAQACAEAAGVAPFITIEQKHFEQAQPIAGKGLVVTNPPYGERLPLPRAGALFRRLGDWLVAQCGGWRAAFLAADTPAAGQLGLRPTHRVPLMNGPIACRLLEVEIRPRSTPHHSLVEGRGEIDPGAGAAAASQDRLKLDELGSFRPEEERTVESLPGERSPRGDFCRPGADGVNGPVNDSAQGTPPLGRPRGRSVADQIGDFRRRLAKRHKHLSKWARRQGIEAFRVYDRDIPEVPLVIDLYAG